MEFLGLPTQVEIKWNDQLFMLHRKTYADSMIHLNIMKPEEEQLVFGRLNALTPLHSALHQGLKKVGGRF